MENYKFDWNFIKSGMPYVTISEISLAFNVLAVQKLGSPKKVILGFDEEKKTIGVKGADNEERLEIVPSYDFATKQGIDGWVRIGCKEFLRYLTISTGISFEKAIRFGVIMENDIMVIRICDENILKRE